MILCLKCGIVDHYKIIQYFEQTKYCNENGECIETSDLADGKRTQPKCPICGREVKFFKDVEEVEDEKTGDHERTV